MEAIRRPLVIIPSFRGEPDIHGTFVINGPERVCDACGTRVSTYAETREEGAPWEMTICPSDLFANADVDGAKISIS